MPTSPTARTLEWLRNNRWEPRVVEHWNPYARIRQDLYNIIDVVGLREGFSGVLGVQATSDSNRSARIQKIVESEFGGLWIRAGNPLWVVTWGKHRPEGGGREVWTPHVTDMREWGTWWQKPQE